MPPERSLLIVNFRSAALTIHAIETARKASASPLEVVVVDNSCDEMELEVLHAADIDHVIVAPSNIGFAAGVNLGLKRCRGETVVISNPDVVFDPSSIDRLSETLDSGATMCGPALYWDRAHEWLLPPSTVPGAWSKLQELAALRMPGLSQSNDRRRIQSRIEFWSLTETTEVEAISGAVICTRTNLLRQFGGFDERFRLYFEEIDLARRIGSDGGSIFYVPGARCRHVYNQSARTVDTAADLYADSEIEYLRKWSGETIVAMMRHFGRPVSVKTDSVVQAREAPIDLAPYDLSTVVVELSPLSGFESAAGHTPRTSSLRVPSEILHGVGDATLFARVIERKTCHVLKSLRLEPDQAAAATAAG